MYIKLLIVNLLTLIRIIGTIILIPIYNYKGSLVAGMFSFICYVTDSVDGILARHWKVSTFFGALFDGLADKLFTIINFIVLYLITPYAIIPVIFELLTIIIQMIKFQNNYNIRSNIIGKLKVWILAFSVVSGFLLSGLDKINIFPLGFKEKITSIPSDTLYFWILLPSIIMCAITFFSYFIEIFKPSKKVTEVTHKKSEVPKMEKNKGLAHFKAIWLNPEFYEAHKNETNLKDLRKLTKE